MNTIKPVLDSATEVKTLLRRDLVVLCDLSQGREQSEKDRLASKAQGVSRGIVILTEAMQMHPNDDDSAFALAMANITRNIMLLEAEGGNDEPGMVSGFEHAFYRMRVARA